MTGTETSTRENLLNVTERLLLESGYEAVSVRAVCAAAGVNPAAVHYHFGSKVGLVTALLEARLGPLWAEALPEVSADDVMRIDTAVQIVVNPIATLAADPAGRLYLHLLARLLLARNEIAWTKKWFTVTPWARILSAQVAGLSERDAARRWMMAFELIFVQFGDPLAGDRRLTDGQVHALRDFITAGLSAPVAQP
ncbi:TetR/AcrR family transcriptional regulator [Mycolicibacter heraklionensis]|uniref:TetR family transcriptional regulator n=1 Tax=Mycolicibacter heraklionensis TaxID=512402 RepID=A0AA91EYS1_9MYCO|nr:TetR/AcrR family transcriptional regulator [Mycolicibacter heraklionensis]OBK83869.1 TetR family transcriptional regulator [Mycolicibacter heraklionensis]